MFLNLGLIAQPANPNNPDLTPIDGGLSLLIAGGAAIGGAHYRKYKKNQLDRE